MTTVVITENAFVAACHPDFPIAEIVDGTPPERFENVSIQSNGTTTLVATGACTETSNLLIIGSGDGKLFDAVRKDEYSTVLERCVRLALRNLDKKIALNPNWMPYRQNNRTSIFATSATDIRIISEVNFSGSNNTFVFGLIKAASAKDLSSLDPDIKAYGHAVTSFPDLLSEKPYVADSGLVSIVLEHLPSRSVGQGFSFEEWLPLLSREQRNFVDRPVTGPLRVRGDAGTGKTLALVMKALNIVQDQDPTDTRILFLTHSWAMANQVDEMIRSIGRDIAASSQIEVYPLLEISSQRDYSIVGRRPLGLDSDSGKRETLSIVSKLVEHYLGGDWIAYRGGCSPHFVAVFEAPAGSRERKNLEWDLLVEFGCVLAAQGLLGRGTDREKYMRIRRVGYMMPLANGTEKEVVFQLWGAFLNYLKVNGLISSDQIISDHLNELQTFFWEAKRVKDGYDYIFVDEMHLFNAQERLIFHNLLSDADITPRVILALDPKQSPREVFTEIADDRDSATHTIYERARLPNPDKVDFIEVYRYTNQIAALARAVLDSVPALDMHDDWNLPAAASVVGPGPIPTYHVVENTLAVFKLAISVARKLQTDARKRQGQVAILCMDFERFEIYQNAASHQFPQEVFVIRSRDDVEQLRYMNRRIVFSTPEYVAGLQFDSVIIVDANGDQVPSSSYKGHQERRFLSELYLGISRAQKEVTIIASRDGDGLSPYLKALEARDLLHPAS